jgi:hypothetical protein
VAAEGRPAGALAAGGAAVAPLATLAGTACVESATTLCIDDQPADRRGQVTVGFHTAQGGGLAGNGNAIPLAGLGVTQGGLFWFFDAGNPEMLIKLLDGCAVNQQFWVFYAATTNVGFTLDVVDTRTGRMKTYGNQDGTAPPPLQDTAAFSCAAGGAGAAFFVAADGNDGWSGTLPAPNAGHTDGPFASLARAQQAVRGLAGTQAVTVQVRAGTYYLPLSPTSPGTLSFGSRDSGTASAPIVWQSHPGEAPVVSGGVPVGSGGLGLRWSQAGNGNLWQVQLPAAIQPFEHLFYRQSGGVDVRYNVVYRMSAFLISLTEGPTVSRPPNPNHFENNIFSLGIRGMLGQGTPWPAGCGTNPGLQVELLWNVFHFDLNETPSSRQGFAVQTGCTNSCGLSYDQFQQFESNAYWRAGKATTGYRVLQHPAADGSCTGGGQSVFLSFASPPMGGQTWQSGRPPATPVAMNEDLNGTCAWDPGFGTTGDPSDYLLASGPPTPFDPSFTNDTIVNAGRTSGPHSLAAVPATFPTYTYGSF